MKNIIVGGCSFTDKDFPTTAMPEPLDFKMWPEVIGEKLNCEVMNFGRCGFGNRAIYHTTLNAIMNNKVDHVIVMWSEWTRQDFLIDSLDSSARIGGSIGGDYISLHPFSSKIKLDDAITWYNDSFGKNFPHKTFTDKGFSASVPNIQQMINTSMNYIYSMQVICKQRGIKYTACQAMETDILPSLLIKHPLIESIENFLGWPIDKKLGGFCMTDLLKKEYGHLAYRVHEKDPHPGEIGQKFMADKIMEYANV